MTWGEPRPFNDPYWASVGKQWVEVKPGMRTLVDVAKVMSQRPPARSSFPSPMIIRDTFDTPLKSMADGKVYDSRAALYRSYRADGNPQGVEYECIGDKPVEPYSRPNPTKDDEQAKDAAISRAIEEAGL